MTQTEVWTIGKLLAWTTEFLKKKGSASPRLEAEVLLAQARDCKRIELYTAFDEEPVEEVKAAFRELVRRRAEGTPVAYLVGHKEFFSIDFLVTPDCLIPRPETEHLVIATVDLCKKELQNERLKNSLPSPSPVHIADVCTGSGCIAVALAKHLPEVYVTAIDISAAALEVAKRNIERLKLDAKIDPQLGDLLTMFDGTIEKFDVIVSNPPYVRNDEFESLPRDVKNFEPRVALVSGESGMEISKRLTEQSLPLLKNGGYLLQETSPMLADQLASWIASISGWSVQPIGKDLQGHSRIVVAKKVV